jgi:hypothetical protein
MFWRREDPVSQLPPGASLERRVKLDIGVTDSTTAELTASLGLSAAVGPAELSAKLGSCLKRTVTLTRQTTVETTVTLTNSSNNYRQFAIWHRIHGIWVALLAHGSNGGFEWSPISDLEYEDPNSSAVNVTYS